MPKSRRDKSSSEEVFTKRKEVDFDRRSFRKNFPITLCLAVLSTALTVAAAIGGHYFWMPIPLMAAFCFAVASRNGVSRIRASKLEECYLFDTIGLSQVEFCDGRLLTGLDVLDYDDMKRIVLGAESMSIVVCDKKGNESVSIDILLSDFESVACVEKAIAWASKENVDIQRDSAPQVE